MSISMHLTILNIETNKTKIYLQNITTKTTHRSFKIKTSKERKKKKKIIFFLQFEPIPKSKQYPEFIIAKFIKKKVKKYNFFVYLKWWGGEPRSSDKWLGDIIFGMKRTKVRQKQWRVCWFSKSKQVIVVQIKKIHCRFLHTQEEEKKVLVLFFFFSFFFQLNLFFGSLLVGPHQLKTKIGSQYITFLFVNHTPILPKGF